MPAAVRWLAFLDPLAHYLSLLRNIMLKGGSPWTLAYHASILVALALACGAVSFRRFHTTLS